MPPQAMKRQEARNWMRSGLAGFPLHLVLIRRATIEKPPLLEVSGFLALDVPSIGQYVSCPLLY